MREIDLRCWNEHGKCFHGMSELGDKLHLFNNKNPSYVIEQSTGLLDCNGVKIFEGDILHFLDPLDYKPFAAEFKDGAFRVAIGKWTMVLDELYIKSSELVVIGNIHQNSELLK